MKGARFARTRAALVTYDKLFQAREILDGVLTDEQSTRLDSETEAADKAVREAFAEDTADCNQKSNAMLVSPRDPWLRRLVKEDEEREG